MGIMNLLKSSWSGKVGQTVGAKWKDKNTIRTFTAPANPNTPAQQVQRTKFASATSFFALFADQIKSLNALDTRSMSVRNALISINKAVMAESEQVEFANLLVSKGGLPEPVATEGGVTASSTTLSVDFSFPNAANISDKAECVLVAVNHTQGYARVATADKTQSEVSVSNFGATAGDSVYLYLYLLDKRGSAKVASKSICFAKTIA